MIMLEHASCTSGLYPPWWRHFRLPADTVLIYARFAWSLKTSPWSLRTWRMCSRGKPSWHLIYNYFTQQCQICTWKLKGRRQNAIYRLVLHQKSYIRKLFSDFRLFRDADWSVSYCNAFWRIIRRYTAFWPLPKTKLFHTLEGKHEVADIKARVDNCMHGPHRDKPFSSWARRFFIG